MSTATPISAMLQIANALTLDEARRPAVGPLLFYCVKTEVPSSHVVAMMPRKSH